MLPIDGRDVRTLVREADVAARRLVRRLQLPSHYIEDARQELLADLIWRLPRYEPTRGTLGAFVGVVLAHKASRIAATTRKQCVLFGSVPISLDEPQPEGNGISRGELVPEICGYSMLFGGPADPIEEVEQRLSIENGLSTLSPKDLQFCAALTSNTVEELANQKVGPRTSLYRQARRVRLDLTAAGVCIAGQDMTRRASL